MTFARLSVNSVLLLAIVFSANNLVANRYEFRRTFTKHEYETYKKNQLKNEIVILEAEKRKLLNPAFLIKQAKEKLNMHTPTASATWYMNDKKDHKFNANER